MKKWLDYASEVLKKPKTGHVLHESFNKISKYEWPIQPDLRKDIKPIRPFVGKLPMQMTFIDNSGRVFKYDKHTKSYLFQYSSIGMKEIFESWLSKP